MSDNRVSWGFRSSLHSSLGNVKYALEFPGCLRSWLRIWDEHDLAAFIQSGVVPFVCDVHLGDNFLLTAFAGEYCKTYGFTGVIVLAPPSQVALLQGMPWVTGAIALNHPIPHNSRFSAWLCGYPPFLRCVLASGVLASSRGYWGGARTFPDVFALGLGLPAGTKPALAPLPSEEELRRATAFLESAGLWPGHTALLVPGSNWTSREHMPDESWRILSQVAKKHGWAVAQNTLGCVTRIPETVGLSIPLEDIVAVGRACGWVIAQRNGLCDVVAGRVPRLTILHSVNTHFDPFRRDSRDRFFSVVESGQDPHANEVFLDDDLDDVQARALMGVQGGS